MTKILITPRSLTRTGHPALELLKEAGYELIFSTPGRQPDEEELIRLLPGCVGYLAGVERISARVLESAKDLRVISRNGTGIDNIDAEAARRLNIRICRAEGANARGVAELTIGLLFALVRWIPFSDAGMKNEQWTRRKGIELENRVLGLIGCGKIGKQVAIFATGLGMKVIAFDCSPDYSFSPDNFNWVSEDELYMKSDIISLHLPALEEGKPLINKETISKMKSGVYLINTARASLIDEEAVLEGLESGHIAGIAIDVYAQEPPSDYRLVKHNRVIATPHIGGYTSESISRATRIAVDNLLKNLQ
ncbi:phosphoglycerate dehydrogenase [Candidatus Sumerlaeota bacterium]|nr:phosphoglycerate dehydrogenase [Candidatus Sumerlaeota bacterium]